MKLKMIVMNNIGNQFVKFLFLNTWMMKDMVQIIMVQIIMLLLIVVKINHFLDSQLKRMDYNSTMFILRLKLNKLTTIKHIY
ncbi:hypothetical protein RhiirA4_550484, partial [Rhizophagus irregularis]